jgi:ribosomal subunit interface protein
MQLITSVWQLSLIIVIIAEIPLLRNKKSMKIIIETPDFKPSPSLKEYITGKVAKLEKLHKAIISAEVTLEVEARKTNEVIRCTIKLSIPGKDEYVKATSSIFEDAILKAVTLAQRRLRIRKTQLMVERKKGRKEKGK